MSFAVGENVGAYRIVEQLGQGGMATVFKAYHPALDRYVAIKVLHPFFMQDPGFLTRFQREARIVARLDHPHIVPIYDSAEHRGHPYLVMRFIEGETLKARTQRGPLDFAETLRIITAIGQALTYAHAQGVLHRDIKPSNALLSTEGGVYLTDFGLARMAEAGESTISRDMVAGTPHYISPEQAKGDPGLDARTDIYSLGVVLYELLVGQVPFTADTPYAIIHDHIFSPLPLPRSLNPELSEPLERLLLKALAKDPADRYQTVAGLVAALGSALAPPPPPVAETVVAPPPTELLPREPPPAPVEQPKAPEDRERPPEAKSKRRGKKEEKRERRRKGKAGKKQRPWIWLAIAAAVLLGVALVVLGVLTVGQMRQADDAPQPETAEQLLASARTAREDEQLARAVELYEREVAADPQLIPAYLEGSGALARLGDTDAAIVLLQQGVAANPDDLALHERLAGLAMLAGRWDVAWTEVEWLLQRAPDNPLPHAYSGVIVLEQGGPCEEALPELEIALELDPRLPWAHYGMARCHLARDDADAARAELELVLGHDRTPPLLRARAEKLLEQLGPEGEDPVGREFDALFRQVERVPERDNLRAEFAGIVDEAGAAWGAGDREASVQTLHHAKGWVEEHWDALGPQLAEELMSRLDRIIDLAGEP